MRELDNERARLLASIKRRGSQPRRVNSVQYRVAVLAAQCVKKMCRPTAQAELIEYIAPRMPEVPAGAISARLSLEAQRRNPLIVKLCRQLYVLPPTRAK